VPLWPAASEGVGAALPPRLQREPRGSSAAAGSVASLRQRRCGRALTRQAQLGPGLGPIPNPIPKPACIPQARPHHHQLPLRRAAGQGHDRPGGAPRLPAARPERSGMLLCIKLAHTMMSGACSQPVYVKHHCMSSTIHCRYVVLNRRRAQLLVIGCLVRCRCRQAAGTQHRVGKHRHCSPLCRGWSGAALATSSGARRARRQPRWR